MVPPQSEPIQAVLFDLDDTLLDWSAQQNRLSAISRPHVDKLYDFLAREGHSLPDKETFFRCYQETVIAAWAEAKKVWAGVNFSQTLQRCFASLQLDVDRIDMMAALHAYDWQALPNVTLYDDTILVLEALRRRRYKIGLVTNSMMPMWMRDIELEAYGILDYFDVRLTSGDIGYMKPHPAIYERALSLLQVQAQQAVFVGDRPANDIAGANAAGLISVLMSPPHLNHQLEEVEPDFVITHLSELLPLLETLQSGHKGAGT